jgi:hypothetical protein
MYNYQADLWLFEALQDYYTEALTEETLIKRRQVARTHPPKSHYRLLKNLGNRLVTLGLKLKAWRQPEAVKPVHRGC